MKCKFNAPNVDKVNMIKSVAEEIGAIRPTFCELS